jgi:mannitol/fructose-specific phosphotransferase system IIA component (Ntr-type)
MVKRRAVSLKKMISQSTTALNVDVSHWEEAVTFAGNLLFKAGFVEERYIQAMINTVKDLGPYAVIVPGVALPHARPEDGAKVPCMSLVTLRTPVEFGNSANDPVKLVIAFATIDHDAHIVALSALAKILGDDNKLEKLKNASDFGTVAEVINSLS